MGSDWCGGYAALKTSRTSRWLGAGIEPKAPGWSWRAIELIPGLLLLLLAVVVLLPLILVLTSLEALRELLGLDTRVEQGYEEHTTLVLPGTCAYLFWQLGMIQYLCEHFDTRGGKLAGVSSGAIAAAMLLQLEELASAESDAPGAVRRRCREIFDVLEAEVAPVLRSPLAFLGRLGDTMERLAPLLLPRGDVRALGERLQIGVRRLTTGCLPAMVPETISSFTCREDLLEAILVSSNVWLVARWQPFRYVRSLNAFCSDGVNPYSLHCFSDYLWQRMSGQYEISAPKHMHAGILDRIYAIWNCTAMKVLLPSGGKRVWISPTVGGRLNMMYFLRFSGWFMGHQWQQGYLHARDLDAAGYWKALPRRPGM